jgi:hypothetical protein
MRKIGRRSAMISGIEHRWSVAIIALMVTFCGAGLAAGEVTVKPRFAATWRADNNFYRAEALDREVWTYLLQPGVDLGLEAPKSLVSMNLTLNDYTYDDQDPVPPGQQPASKEDYTGHTLVLKARYRPSDRLLLGIEDSNYKTRDPAQSDVFSNSIDREKYTINRLTPQVFYDFGPKFSLGVKYRYTETDYDVATGEDSTEHRAVFDLVYNLTPKTSLDLEYQHWNRDYSVATSDYTSDQINLIVRKQFQYLSLEAGGGYHDRSFDDETVEGIDVFTYRIAVIGQNPPAPEPMPRSYITCALEQNLNDQGIGEEYFTARRFSLDAWRLFREKIVASIGLFYQTSDYERTTGLTPEGTIALREDETSVISGGLGYRYTDWLTLSITAGFEDRESNLAGLSYDNRYYMATLDFTYELGAR